MGGASQKKLNATDIIQYSVVIPLLFHICKVLTDNLPAGVRRAGSFYRSMEVILYIPLHFVHMRIVHLMHVHMRVYGHPDQQSGEKRGSKYLLCLNGSYATVVYPR